MNDARTDPVGPGGGMDDELLGRYAELLVGFGANVQEDQILRVRGELGHERPARAVAEAAYRRGARFVDVGYFDSQVKRIRLLHAREETLDFVPSWYGDALLAAHEQECANVGFAGPVNPGLYDDLDAKRVGRDLLPYLRETEVVMSVRRINACWAPWPNPAWARLVHPTLDGAQALAQLTGDIVHMLRLDEEDPVRAWQHRFEELRGACARLNERSFDAVRLEGPGTDLTIGLFRGSRWCAADTVSTRGIRHVLNLPTEEVFTTPDPERVDGVVRATRPLSLGVGQPAIRDLSIRFEDGRAVDVDAASGVDALRARLALDEGARRVGEIALVDDGGRIGRLDTTFYNTLIDENATSHMALGFGLDFALADDDAKMRRNRSAIHQDFMIGGPDVVVTGITAAGDRVVVLDGGRWAI